MNISASLISVPLATIAIVVINSIWFGPKTFYPVWWKAMGKEMKKPEDRDTSGKTMLRLFGGSFAAALAQAIVLFVAIFASGFSIAGGAIMGLGFGVVAAGASLAHRLFGEQGFKVWIIEVAADIIALMAAGAIIAAFVAH
jgi:hypothetical protein